MRLLLTCAALLAGGIALADPPKANDEDKVERAKQDMQTITKACQAYKLKYDDYPEKLELLVKPPSGISYIKAANLLDPWKEKYQYDPKGTHNGGLKPDIWAVTPGKKVIGNWPEEKK